MALTINNSYFLLRLKLQAFRDRGFSLVDIGEQNWFGKTPLRSVVDTARKMSVPITDSDAHALHQANADHVDPFAKARAFYRHLLGVNYYETIDLHGTKAARRINLNRPFDPERQFDVVLNFGTTEHVFNQFEAFNTIHKLCAVGGFMVHGLPLSGGREHGFFNYHTTTFFDLCAANGYALTDIMWSQNKKKGDRVVAVAETFSDRVSILKYLDELPLGDEGIFFSMRKERNAPFECPMQGYYDSQLEGDNATFLKTFWNRHR